MLESFKQQEQMSVLELYIEKDVAGGSMFHSANSLTSCGNYLSNDETQPTINMSNLHIDEDDDGDDDDYLVSNSYVEESLDEDDSVDGISDTDDEVTNIPQPVRIVHPTEDTWKVTQWGGPHTCLNMTITQDHEKLDSDLIATCVVERINSEFAYKVSYKKAWLAKQKAIAIEYGDRDESYAKLGSIKSVVANEALGWQPPHGYHVYCVRHIASNFNRKFNNAKQKEMLKKLEKFRELSPAIATWIDRISKEKWTMAYDREGRRYGHMTTNLSECINKVLKDCRNIPITALVKSMYSRFQKYFVERGRQAQRQLNEGQVYCSKLVKELRKNQEQACSHIVRVYDIHSTRFEVEETFNPITQRGGQKWTVNLNACGYVSLNYYQYIDVVYTNEHIVKAYSAQWWPLGNVAAIPPSNDAWTLIPDPTTIRAKGWPKSTRIRNEMDWVEPSEH
ncbi:hypothetical protein GmHk_18G052091 [Glycine max]|nr:hypothetical protein GmHk_18G052091 [Glycine max]